MPRLIRELALREARARFEGARDDERADLVVGEADDRTDSQRPCRVGVESRIGEELTFDVRTFYRACDQDASPEKRPTDTGGLIA